MSDKPGDKAAEPDPAGETSDESGVTLTEEQAEPATPPPAEKKPG